jgi:alpha-2-macroglobulin
LRAEIPGRFSALPTQASAMYAPELRGNSEEIKLGVED